MEFDLFKHTHYLVIAGSHSYGMATAESDLDIRGWCIPPVEYYRSYHKHFEQAERKILPKDLPKLPKAYTYRYWNSSEPADVVCYELRKFFKLAADCNPNIIELLYIDPGEIIFSSPFGSLLRHHASKFLSGRAKFSFSGYARAQLKRINTHKKWLMHPPSHKPTRAEYELPENSVISPDRRQAAEALLEKQARLWLLEEAEVDKTIISAIKDSLCELLSIILANSKSYADILDDNKLFELAKLAASSKYSFDEKYIVVLQAEKRYRDALTEWNQYQNWIETRNKKRAELEAKFSYDTKHASHLVRLMLQCEEILTSGQLTVKHPERAKLLLEIRQGGWSYDELIEWTDKIEAKLDAIYKDGSYLQYVPKAPDVNYLDGLCQEIICKYTWEP